MKTSSTPHLTRNNSAKRRLLFVFMPLCAALAACDGNSQPFEEQAEALTLDLASVSVGSPPNVDSTSDIIINQDQQIELGITGTSSTGTVVNLDSSDRRWVSSDNSVLTVNSDGVVTGLEDGFATVSVLISNLASDELSFQVSDSELVEISAIVGEGNVERCVPAPYFATGLYEDGTTRTLFDADFILDQSSTALIDAANQSTILVNANTAGAITLIAQSGDLEPLSLQLTVLDTLQSISVSPNPLSIDVDDEVNFIATGFYQSSDGETTTVEITDNINWVVDESSGGEGSIDDIGDDDPGEFTAEEEGTVQVQAFCGLDVTNIGIRVAVIIDEDDDEDDDDDDDDDDDS